MTYGPILGIDTATSEVVVVLASADGDPRAERRWAAGYRHGERLLPTVQSLLADEGLDRRDVAGIVTGTGPGAFTGLRVGLATAKALAHGLGRPIAGVSTAEALLAAATVPAGVPAEQLVLLLPAGPSDRVVVRAGAGPQVLRAGLEPELAEDEVVVAVDLENRAPPEATALGRRALDGLGRELARLGAPRLAAGGDDLAGLVPEYVSLPRGVAAATGEVAWSRGHR